MPGNYYIIGYDLSESESVSVYQTIRVEGNIIKVIKTTYGKF